MTTKANCPKLWDFTKNRKVLVVIICCQTKSVKICNTLYFVYCIMNLLLNCKFESGASELYQECSESKCLINDFICFYILFVHVYLCI